MADELEEKVLLEVNFDIGDVTDKLTGIKTSIDGVKSKLKELSDQKSVFAEQGKDATALNQQIVVLEAELRSLTSTQKNLQKQVDTNTQANKANAGSYEQLYRQWQLAQTQLKLLEGTLKRNADGTIQFTSEFILARQEVASAKDALDQFNLTLNDGRTSVGQYGKALDPLQSEVAGLRKEHRDLTNTMQGAVGVFSLLNIVSGNGEKATQAQKDAMIGLVAIQSISEIRLGVAASLKTADYIITLAQEKATKAATVATATWGTVTAVLSGEITVATAATAAWNAVLALNPIIAIATAIALTIAAIYQFVTAEDLATQAVVKNSDAMKEKMKLYDDASSKEIELAKSAGKETISLEQKKNETLHAMAVDEVSQRLAIQDKLHGDELSKNTARINELIKQEQDLDLQLQQLDIQRGKNAIDAVILLSDSKIAAMKDGLEKELAQVRAQNAKEKSEADTKLVQDGADLQTRLDVLNNLDLKGKVEEQKIIDKYNKQAEDAEKKHQDELLRIAKQSQADWELTLKLKNGISAAITDFEISEAQRAKDAKKPIYDESADDAVAAIDKINNANTQSINKQLQDAEQLAQEKQKLEQEITNQLFQINENFLQSRIDQIQEEERAGRISKEQAHAEIVALRRKEDASNKAQALFNIAISTAENVAKAFNPALIPFYVALGATEAAAVISRPIPQYAKGGIIGGKPHSQGGTKFFGEDGTTFEAEAGELIAVVNKNSTAMLGTLSWMNQHGGGDAFDMSNGKTYLADGGFAARSMSTPVLNSFNVQEFTSAIELLPNPIVRVTDINAVNGKLVSVSDRANI